MERPVGSPRKGLLLLAGALAGLACASELESGVSFDPIEPFPGSATWSWDERSTSMPEDPRIVALGLEPILRDAIESQLARRGYRRVAARPHYLVTYHLEVATRLRPEETVSIGSLSLLMLRPDTKKPVWNGYARAEVDLARSPEARGVRLREAVQRLLEHFPPGARR